jgi:NAD+ kinase
LKVAIFGQQYQENTLNSIHVLLNCLTAHGANLLIEENFARLLESNDVIDFKSHQIGVYNHLDDSFDLLVSIGGDGTILRAITRVKDLEIPIVGINTGRLGFLATVQTNEIERAFNDIYQGNYSISSRSLVAVTTNPPHPDLTDINFALNEIAVSRKNTTSMISVETQLNDEYLTAYWSDGLIVSTPTGSTGYSLSCGGPVIIPQAGNFVITPIAPHNLNARPLVIPDTTKITLNVNSREDDFLLSLDSRLVSLSTQTEVVITKAHFKIKMIEFKYDSFISTLRKKMLWGEDKRN